MFNETALTHIEFRTHFSRIFSLLMNFSNTMKPDKIDEIGEKVLKRYFPSGNIEDDSHIEAVQVRNDQNIK